MRTANAELVIFEQGLFGLTGLGQATLHFGSVGGGCQLLGQRYAGSKRTVVG
jgi:hypothetical protein